MRVTMKTPVAVVLCIFLVAGPITGEDTRLGLPQCITNDDCLETLTCSKYKCEDPCLSFCTGNSYCQVRDHAAYCSCKPGFTGDPLAGCSERALILEHHCTKNDECSQDQTCIDQKCEDPCIDVCSGNNTICQVRKHVPYCSCKHGYSGNPLSACRLQYPPGSWPPYPGSKKRYQVEAIKANWYGAFAHCMNHGGRLATIMNSVENDEIKELIRKTGLNFRYWASGANFALDNPFTWMSTGLPFTFSDWSSGQPDNWQHLPGGEHCLELWVEDNYRWNDRNCMELQYSICEYYDW